MNVYNILYRNMNINVIIHMKNKGSKRKVQCNGRGQWTITIPSSIAAAMKFNRGEELEWGLNGKILELRKVNK